MTVMNPAADPRKYWETMCDRYPSLRMIDTFFRRAPDISQRYGRVYCKSEWLLGPEQSVSTPNAVSIPDVGVERNHRYLTIVRNNTSAACYGCCSTADAAVPPSGLHSPLPWRFYADVHRTSIRSIITDGAGVFAAISRNWRVASA